MRVSTIRVKRIRVNKGLGVRTKAFLMISFLEFKTFLNEQPCYLSTHKIENIFHKASGCQISIESFYILSSFINVKA